MKMEPVLQNIKIVDNFEMFTEEFDNFLMDTTTIAPAYAVGAY